MGHDEGCVGEHHEGDDQERGEGQGGEERQRRPDPRGAVVEPRLPRVPHDLPPRRQMSQLPRGTDDPFLHPPRVAFGDRALAEWVVAAPAGVTLKGNVRHERAGSARAEVVLGELRDRNLAERKRAYDVRLAEWSEWERKAAAADS